jgi:F-type H+-transporting ATPase subunit gamma
VISSDKGLCGGIHSSVTKYTRAALKSTDEPIDANSPIMIIGDKSKAQLSRALPTNLAMTFNQIGRDIPTFADASSVADLIIKSGVEYDSVVIVYNKFMSAISFEATSVEVQTEVSLREARASLSYLVVTYADADVRRLQLGSKRTRWKMMSQRISANSLWPMPCMQLLWKVTPPNRTLGMLPFINLI